MEAYPSLQSVIGGFDGDPIVGLTGRFFRDGNQINVISDRDNLPEGVDDAGKFSYGGFHDRSNERGLILHGVLPGKKIEFEGIRVVTAEEGYRRLEKGGMRRIILPLTSAIDRKKTAHIVAESFPDVAVTYTYVEP